MPLEVLPWHVPVEYRGPFNLKESTGVPLKGIIELGMGTLNKITWVPGGRNSEKDA